MECGTSVNVGDLIDEYYQTYNQDGTTSNNQCMVMLPLPARFVGKDNILLLKLLIPISMRFLTNHDE